MSDKSFWPYEEAQGIIDYFGGDLPAEIYFETGYGPSGPPHMGTFGEIARTMFVQFALKSLGHSVKIIAFSDDMDGLRKVPLGFPASLQDHLGKPLSRIPDPFGCNHDSYSDHMISLLEEMVELAGADVVFKYSSKEYKKGKFNDEIKTILQNHRRVTEIATHDYSSETQATWFPFFVICDKCGGIYTTRILDVDAEATEIRYACDQDFDTSHGCGNVSTASALNGGGKLPWKVDWAARWHAYNIKYEIYGSDLIPSAEVSDKICYEIFNWKPPKHMSYELFLDEDGSKISKSKGEAINPTSWLKYGSLRSLSYLFYYKPWQAKKLSLARIPTYVRDANAIEIDYYEKLDAGEDISKHDYCFITQFKPPERYVPKPDFSVLINLIAALGTNDKEIIRDYAKKTLEIRSDDISLTILDEEIDRALSYYQDIQSKGETLLDISEITDNELISLDEYWHYIVLKKRSPFELHSAIHDIARKNSLTAGHFFRLIYKILIRQERGPRLGNFIDLLGQNYVASILLKTLMEIKTTRMANSLQSDLSQRLDQLTFNFSNLINGFEHSLSVAKQNLGDVKNIVNMNFSKLEKDTTVSDDQVPEADMMEEINAARTVPTKKLFKDSYLKEFEATVTKILGTMICLDQTCFYPESGGQAGDTGTINGHRVIDTQYKNNDIVHILDDEPDFSVGDKVQCAIDWERRYRIMKLHSACHVMEYYLFKVFGELERVGSLVNDEKDRSSYAFKGRLPNDKLEQVNELVNTFIAQKLDIERVDDPKYPEFRHWICGEISEPCGGTHPKNMSEIGQVQLTRKNAGRDKESVLTTLVIRN